MKIVVTGGAGFIGSNFVRRLLGGAYRGLVPDEVLVLDALTYAGNPENLKPVQDDPRFSFVHGDVRDPETVARVLRRADMVVHFAAESHVDRSIADGSDFVDTNIVGTFNLMRQAHGGRSGRLVVVSTDEVYGSIDAGSWDEHRPLQPNSVYAASKASVDMLGMSFHRTHGIDIVTVRPSNNYGPYQHPEKLIPRFITDLLDGRKVPVYGDGTNVREWLHVDDCCRGIALAAVAGRSGEVYNIGSGRELSNLDLTGLLLDLTGADWSSVDFVDDRPGHDFRYSMDFQKAGRELGYQPESIFHEALADVVEWYAKNREWWTPLKETGNGQGMSRACREEEVG